MSLLAACFVTPHTRPCLARTHIALVVFGSCTARTPSTSLVCRERWSSEERRSCFWRSTCKDQRAMVTFLKLVLKQRKRRQSSEAKLFWLLILPFSWERYWPTPPKKDEIRLPLAWRLLSWTLVVSHFNSGLVYMTQEVEQNCTILKDLLDLLSGKRKYVTSVRPACGDQSSESHLILCGSIFSTLPFTCPSE